MLLCVPNYYISENQQRILYGRKGSKTNRFIPYKVQVKSTLGAGDTFRAGVVYGIFKGWMMRKQLKLLLQQQLLYVQDFL